MSLSQNLSEFKFTLETMDLLVSMGRNNTQTMNEMLLLGYTTNQVNFMQTSRQLLNGVLLRLNLYSEQNIPEAKVRSSIGVLNNVNINSLLDTVFLKSQTSSQHFNTEPVVETKQLDEDDEDEPKNEVSRFDQFYNACVKKTTDPTDIVKTADFYTAFSDWWGSIYEDVVPDKTEFKDFISVKLGKSNKNTWSNIRLA